MGIPVVIGRIGVRMGNCYTAYDMRVREKTDAGKIVDKNNGQDYFYQSVYLFSSQFHAAKVRQSFSAGNTYLWGFYLEVGILGL